MEKLLILRTYLNKLENEMNHSLNSLRSTFRYDSLISKTLLHRNITVDCKQNFLYLLILYKFIIVTYYFIRNKRICDGTLYRELHYWRKLYSMRNHTMPKIKRLPPWSYGSTFLAGSNS